jgi:hypothetical protein
MKSVPLMTRGMSLAAFIAALVLCFGFGLTQAEQSMAAQPVAHGPNGPLGALPGFADRDRPEVQVLLSSIDMTVSFAAISISYGLTTRPAGG